MYVLEKAIPPVHASAKRPPTHTNQLANRQLFDIKNGNCG